MKKILPLLLLLSVFLGMVGCKDTPTVTTKDPLSYNLPYPFIDPTDYCKIDLDFDRLSVSLDKDLQITEEDVDEYIHGLFDPKDITKVDVTDRPIKKGDTVYFYYHATVDGKPFRSNREDTSPYRLTVGSNALYGDIGVYGFDEKLIGIVPADTYSHISAEGTVKAGDVVYFSGSLVYTEDNGEKSSDTIDLTRLSLLDVPASYGAGFGAAFVGATIGDSLNITLTEDFDGDGKDETKEYYLAIEKAGEEQSATLSVVLPKLYSDYPALAGKTVTFEVVVSHIEDKVYPELTREFIIEQCKYIPSTADPVAEYRAVVRRYLEDYYAPYKTQAVEGKLLDLFCESMTNLTYPEGTLVYCYEYYMAEIQLLMEAEQKKYEEGTCPFTTFEEFVLLYYDDPALEGKTTDDVDEWIMAKCERTVKENLAVFYIGRALGFQIADSEVRRYAAATANQLNQEQATVKHTEDSVLRDLGWDYIACNVMYAKVMTYLTPRTTVTYQ